MKKFIVFTTLMVLALPAQVMQAQAQEFRSINRIAKKGKAPEGATAVANVKPVSRDVIEQGMREIMAAWNKGDTEKYLADNFYDKRRLDDSISTNMPRDAKVTVQGIKSIQTLEQFQKEGEVISRVSVTVNTTIEYNDPTRGFQSYPGTTEYILNVKGGI